MAPMTWNRNRPAGVVVSMPCLSTMRLMSRSCRSGSDLGEIPYDLAILDNLVMTSSSPDRR